MHPIRGGPGSGFLHPVFGGVGVGFLVIVVSPTTSVLKKLAACNCGHSTCEGFRGKCRSKTRAIIMLPNFFSPVFFLRTYRGITNEQNTQHCFYKTGNICRGTVQVSVNFRFVCFVPGIFLHGNRLYVLKNDIFITEHITLYCR